MRMFSYLALAATGLALAATPAAADVLPTTAYYFGCTGDQKYQGNQVLTWSTTKPAASFQTGAGCGSVDPGLENGDANGHRLEFRGGGNHNGEIETVTVELYSLLTSQLRSPADYPGYFQLKIDDDVVALSDDAANKTRIKGDKVNNGLTEKIVFSFANPLPVDDETGDPTGEPRAPLAGPGNHAVEVTFSSRTLEYQNVWVWGASEVPAGVVINGQPAGLVISPE